MKNVHSTFNIREKTALLLISLRSTLISAFFSQNPSSTLKSTITLFLCKNYVNESIILSLIKKFSFSGQNNYVSRIQFEKGKTEKIKLSLKKIKILLSLLHALTFKQWLPVIQRCYLPVIY